MSDQPNPNSLQAQLTAHWSHRPTSPILPLKWLAQYARSAYRLADDPVGSRDHTDWNRQLDIIIRRLTNALEEVRLYQINLMEWQREHDRLCRAIAAAEREAKQ